MTAIITITVKLTDSGNVFDIYKVEHPHLKEPIYTQRAVVTECLRRSHLVNFIDVSIKLCSECHAVRLKLTGYQPSPLHDDIENYVDPEAEVVSVAGKKKFVECNMDRIKACYASLCGNFLRNE